MVKGGIEMKLIDLVKTCGDVCKIVSGGEVIFKLNTSECIKEEIINSNYQNVDVNYFYWDPNDNSITIDIF